MGRLGNHQAVEQFTRPQRQLAESGVKRNEDDTDGRKTELQEKLALNENLINNLQCEVVALKAELERVKSLNVGLESQ